MHAAVSRPRFTVLVLVVLTAALALRCAGRDAVSEPVPRYDAATFFDTVSISGASFSADETKILISSDKSGIFNAYAQPVAGGEPVQLTDSTTDATYGVTFFPEDDRFLYAADQGGNERSHIYVRELDGTSRDLTPGDDLVARYHGWNGDRSAFYVSTNERDPRAFDLYRYAVDGYERERVFQNDGGYFVQGASDDGRWVGLTKVNTNVDSDVFVYDTESGETIHVTLHEGNVEQRFAGFSPDSATLYYGTNGNGEFFEIWSYDLSSGERAAEVAAEWDVLGLSFSDQGTYRAVWVNADASTEVSVVETATGEELDLPDLGAGEIVGLSFSRSESKLAYYRNGDRAPSNLYVLDLESEDGEPRQLTESLSNAIDPEVLVDAEVVRFESYDGLEIPSLLYRPRQATVDRPVPAMLWMHGGPGGQSRHGYRAAIQHLVNHGYAIFAVNNRGSSGYGKTFNHLDDRAHGEADLRDCVAAVDYLAGLDWVDGERIGIMGGSYGGYLVAAGLAFHPEVFDVGIDIFGVTNWLRTLQEMPAWWGPQRQALYDEMGDPSVDEERLRRISPLFHAANITKPLLVVQGANDPRVLQVESDELVDAVKANGVPVEYIVFPDEGHGFRSKANRIRAQEAYLAFLDRYLRGEGSGLEANEPAASG